MLEADLRLAPEKTELLLVTGRQKRESLIIDVGGWEFVSELALQFLGVWLDIRVNFGHHVENTCDSTTILEMALAWLMPNVGGLKTARRRLYEGVVQSVLLYGAPVWVQSLSVKSRNNRIMTVLRRCAICVACAYRTVSSSV
ncbi:uncharacterized protein LOC142325704 [Lycorma delicatula]|uniref:uncharacterized protein LOC142325704 n=1 Tax=Lycorma delicatula TaxID=130591 RepID=UPI003F51A3CC